MTLILSEADKVTIMMSPNNAIQCALFRRIQRHSIRVQRESHVLWIHANAVEPLAVAFIKKGVRQVRRLWTHSQVIDGLSKSHADNVPWECRPNQFPFF
jgi:hypothetical protein